MRFGSDMVGKPIILRRGLAALMRPSTTAWCVNDGGDGDDDDDKAGGGGTGGDDGDTGDDGDDTGGDDEADDEAGLPEAVKAVLRKNRRELREAQKASRKVQEERDALAREKAEREQAEMTELERERARADAAEAQAAATAQRLRQTQIRSAIEAEATRQEAVNAGLVFRLIPDDEIEADDDGVPSNAEELVAAILEEHPYLKAPATSDDDDDETPPRRVPPTGKRDKTGVTDAEKEQARARDKARIGRSI